jgi:hypothetical protein
MQHVRTCVMCEFGGVMHLVACAACSLNWGKVGQRPLCCVSFGSGRVAFQRCTCSLSVVHLLT